MTQRQHETLGQMVDRYGRSRLRRTLFSRSALMPSGCLEYQGCIFSTGYGQIGFLGKVVGVHRVSYALEHGDIPPGMSVLHHCDNRPCFHPDHLFAGTQADNVRDMRTKGREPRGFRIPQTKLSDEQVTEIRRRFVLEYEPYKYGIRSNAAELAVEFGVSKSYICALGKGAERKGVL